MKDEIVSKIQKFLEATPFALFGALDDKSQLKESIRYSENEWNENLAAPLVSIIMPLYNSHPSQLEQAILSVMAQSYQNWELIAIDDGSPSREHLSIIKKYAKSFPEKILYSRSSKNEGISATRNKAIVSSKGKWLGFLDHDDLLHPLAISEAVKKLDLSNATFAYSFEVKITEDGLNLREFFSKPNFSWFTLLHLNYVCHFSLVSRALLNTVRLEGPKWFDPAFDGAEDHELYIRCSQSPLFKPVVVPQFLYYWRMTPQSTSLDQANKPLSKNRNILAAFSLVHEDLYSGNEGNTQHRFRTHTFLRPQYHVAELPISLIITSPIVGDPGTIGLSNQEGVQLEIPVNGSELISFGSEFLNKSIQSMKSQYILFVHPTVKLKDPLTIRDCIEWLERYPNIGSVGISIVDVPRVPSLDSPDLDAASYPIHTAYSIREQPGMGGGYRFSSFLEKRWFSFESRCVLANTKHFMVMRRRDFEKLGGFDFKRFAYRGFDLDLGMRIASLGLENINLGAIGAEGFVMDECKLGFGEPEQTFLYEKCTTDTSIFQLCYNHAYNVNELKF